MMQDALVEIARAFLQAYPSRQQIQTRWQEPLLAFADAKDPLFVDWQMRFGMRSPFEILPQARTVVVYFLPFSAEIVHSNGPGTIASHEWVLAYVETNALIEALSQELVAWLGKKGIASVAPPPTHNFDPLRLVSDWSHKRAGFIAGLGTFGLHRMLITAKGCGGRLGSLVIAADIEPTPRPDEPYCLFAHDGGCRSCLNRCPSQALQENGFNRQACYRLCLENGSRHKLVAPTDVCGKCTSGVPCSLRNSVEVSVARHRE
jgi:epoxyqueuosine reductase QueG